ncbi:MAG: HAMP domain-containing sensor histidine kinase [Planctomycetota bacterium]|nr:HAMP domain-containing sensor histidine kinase [Planctomycetota bacterium]
MLDRKPIRQKILYCTLLLVGLCVCLAWYGWEGVSSYRELTINVGLASGDNNRLSELQTHVGALSVEASAEGSSIFGMQPQLASLRSELQVYREAIAKRLKHPNPLLATTNEELENLEMEIENLERLEKNWQWHLGSDQGAVLRQSLRNLGEVLYSNVSRQNIREMEFRDAVRQRYRGWQAGLAVSFSCVLITVIATFVYFRQFVVKPFKELLLGSERIANGEFDHRIQMDSEDELADLASALNGMTDRFVRIRDNLNEQVSQRTQEVVRSEQLASVGFLAAGVAHEINNPMATIAWSAEALEMRIHEVIHDGKSMAKDGRYTLTSEQMDIVRDYLRRIQDEAFRCKDITERLLDFSRLGESSRKQETDIHEAVADVCELVRHLGQYRNRTLEFEGRPETVACVSPTEFKQVVLNLLTNALDASEDGSQVRVTLQASKQEFFLTIEDHGCGMTEEVKQQLFEPFFTRRRDGRGTGLGLSITYQIVQDHGGSLVPSSDGPGTGSTMLLTLPITPLVSEANERRRAA